MFTRYEIDVKSNFLKLFIMVSGLSLLSLFPILYKQLDYGYHRVEDPDVIFLLERDYINVI